MRALSKPWVLALALAAGGCLGDDPDNDTPDPQPGVDASTNGSDGSVACVGGTADGARQVIDFFDTEPALEIDRIDGRFGTWYLVTDSTDVTMTEEGSAIRFQGTMDGTHATIGFPFVGDVSCGYDAGDRTGIFVQTTTNPPTEMRVFTGATIPIADGGECEADCSPFAVTNPDIASENASFDPPWATYTRAAGGIIDTTDLRAFEIRVKDPGPFDILIGGVGWAD